MNSFSDMNLPEELEKALENLQFITPTKVQKAVIPAALKGQDLIACAETGSGKTAAYGIPIATRLSEDTTSRALILAPTRELVTQISDFLRHLTRPCGLTVTSIVGGMDIRKQLKGLKRNPRVVVATPGRLTDHLKRGSLELNDLKYLVLDEGDRMLDMGFAPQLDVILRYLPDKRQTMLFSATLPPKVRSLANKYLQNPIQINVGRVSLPVASIKQSAVKVAVKDKDDRILDELNSRTGSVIVFLRTKRRTDFLAKHLKSYGHQVDLIHGGRTQGQRNKAIQSFREGRSRILCATDVAARGIDIPQVEHVINFDLPMMDEDYVHRIGRTARNGAQGEAVSFVTPEDNRTWIALAKKYQIQGVNLAEFESPRAGHKKKPTGKPSLKGKKKFSGKPSFKAKKESSEKPSFKAKKESSEKPSFKAKEESSGKPSFKSKKKASFKAKKKTGFKPKKKASRSNRPVKSDGYRPKSGNKNRARA